MKYKHKKFVLQWSPVWLLVSWMRKIHFTRHEEVSLYKIVKCFLRNLEDDEIMDRANGVAFNFILATFPAIIFLFTLIPYVSDYFPSINQESIMGFMRDTEIMPASMYDVASSTVMDIVNNQRGGLLTLGFFFAMYLSTNGMMALMRAFNACYKTVENRRGWKTRLIAMGLTFNMTIVLFLAIFLLVIGQLILDYVQINLREFINFDQFTVYLLLALRFLVIFIVFFITISTIYFFGPAIHYNWRFFSIGSFIATLLCIAVSYGFSFYVTNFSTYNKVYGSIGVLIALMVWIQLITLVLLFGYEINASIHETIRAEALWKARKYRLSKQLK